MPIEYFGPSLAEMLHGSRTAWSHLTILLLIPVHPVPGCRRDSMEIAALVLFGSIALWFAEELSGNRL
jgi:hypothetical protein